LAAGLAAFRSAVDRHPENPALRCQYGRFLLVAKRDPDAAIEQFNLAIGRDPGRLLDKTARFQLAEAYSMKHQWDKAAEQWSAVLNLDASSVEARARLAVFCLGKGEAAEARRLCMEGIQLGADDMQLRYVLAETAKKEGNASRALEEAKKAFDLALRTREESLDQNAASIIGYYLVLLDEAPRDTKALSAACDAVLAGYPFPAGKSVAMVAKARVLLNARQGDKAVLLLEGAAKEGNFKAMAMLGDMYEGGTEVKQDYGEAVRWYRMAGEKGETSSMLALAILHYEGRGCAQDVGTAIQWLEKYAAQQQAMGSTEPVLRGFARQKDNDRAVALFDKAASLGSPAAMHLLGNCCELGVGTAKDLEQAKRWYKKAADAGDQRAKDRLAALEGAPTAGPAAPPLPPSP